MFDLEEITSELTRAVAVIKRGGVVAFPTETYYGLAVDPFNHKALQCLFSIKQRPAIKPILTLISAASQLPYLAADIPPLFHPLMARYWPGPLTLVFPARPGLSPLLTAGSDTVGIRISSHPVAQALVRLAAAPITATSANISGRSPALSAADIHAQFGNQLDMVLDAGPAAGGLSSTVVGASQDGLVMLRRGVVPLSC